MLKVVFILLDHMLATSVTLPMELLRSADTLVKAKSAHNPRPVLDVTMASSDGGSISTHTGIPLAAHKSFSEINHADLIYLPALWRNPLPIIRKNQPLIEWLQLMYTKGSLIAGVGTGCCFMAEAGLLDNRPATTHWHFFDQFQRWYPLVKLKRQYFITHSGNLYCTGSVNALAELTAYFIQRFFSTEVSNYVERHFFHEIRRAYDGEKSLQDTLLVHPDEDIIQMQIWLKDNLDKSNRFSDLAKQFNMSERTFMRRFKNATGITPLTYLQGIRMDMAKDLLQSSNLSVEDIMYRVGYQDAAHFTSLFKKYHNATPSQYRTTVRAKLFSLEN